MAKDVAVKMQRKYRPRIAQNLLGGVQMQSKGAVHLQRWGQNASGVRMQRWGTIAKASVGWSQNAKASSIYKKERS